MKPRLTIVFITFLFFVQNSFGKPIAKSVKKTATPKLSSISKSSKMVSNISKKKGLKFIKVKVLINTGDSLGDILRRFVRDDSVIFRGERMVERTLAGNKHVKDWHNLKTGEMIYVYLDPKFIDMEKMNRFRTKIKRVTHKIEKKLDLKRKNRTSQEEVKKFSIFYMTSLGQFSQKNSSLAKIDFKQNSPVTFGSMYTYFPQQGNYTIATSAYFSYLLAATTNTDESNIDLPLEVGLNAYYQLPIFQSGYYFYAGADYEKFNTFNLEGIENSGGISFDENQVFFLTGGISKTFSLFKTKFLFKGSGSYSLWSDRKSGFSDESSSKSYKGYKIMGFLLTKVSTNFFASTLLKYHVLEGPSDVTSLRIGVGVGYLF